MDLFKINNLGLSAKSARNTTRPTVIQSSPFLRLPAEVRNTIYGYAFAQRTKLESLRTLYAGRKANSASGLTFSCRQLYAETKPFYEADTMVQLWDWTDQNADSSYTSAKYFDSPISACHHLYSWPESWLKTEDARILHSRLGTVKSIAWQVCMTRDFDNACGMITSLPALSGIDKVKFTDLFVRICLCDAVGWLADCPEHTMSFCIALETLVMQFSTLSCIHVCYCGREWPSWLGRSGKIPFPHMILEQWRRRQQSGANWTTRISNKGVDDYANDLSHASDCNGILEVSDAGAAGAVAKDSIHQVRTQIIWNKFQIDSHPGQPVQKVPWASRVVDIDYYDSFTLFGERCVREKPPWTSTSYSQTSMSWTVQTIDTNERTEKPIITKSITNTRSAASKIECVKSFIGATSFEFRRPWLTGRPLRDMAGQRKGRKT